MSAFHGVHLARGLVFENRGDSGIPAPNPVKMSAQISSWNFGFCESMLVKLKSGDFVGFGEAVTDPVFTGETVESIVGAIRNYLGPAVLGMNPFSLREIHSKMDGALVKNTAAKAAIDTACLDAVGKASGDTVYWKALKTTRLVENYDISLLEQPLPARDLKACALLIHRMTCGRSHYSIFLGSLC